MSFLAKVYAHYKVSALPDNELYERLAAWVNQEVDDYEKLGIIQIGDLFSPEMINFVKSLNTKPPSMTLYRGLFWPSFADALKVSNAVLKQSPKLGQVVPYHCRQPSSWSVKQNIAKGFSMGGNFGITIKAVVTPSDILGYIPALASKLKGLVSKYRKEGLETEEEVIVASGKWNAEIVDIYDPDKEITGFVPVP